ncbi:MAG: hypothetical protein LC721_05240 [Actinobacteria bacterium]|nr:hypothetical protein [Actinomycetota bacterium]
MLDERQRRLVTGGMARALGRGGPTRVGEAPGLSRSTVITGAREMAAGAGPSDRIRAPGTGRRFLVDEQPGLLRELDDLVEPESRGDLMSALRWTAKSTENLARALVAKGYKISADTVGRLLKAMDYSLQAPAKQLEGAQTPTATSRLRRISRQRAPAELRAGGEHRLQESGATRGRTCERTRRSEVRPMPVA